MKTLILIALFSVAVRAEELSVVDVRRNITLSDEDPVYKDFYINAGESSSLRKNMVVNVKRKITVKDAGTKSVGDFETVVGQLKVIHVGSKVSVAREFKLTPRDEEPMIEQIGIMSGDRVDLTGSFIDNGAKAKTKSSADEPVKKEELEAKNAPEEAPKSEVVPPMPSVQPEPAREPANLLNKIIPMPSI